MRWPRRCIARGKFREKKGRFESALDLRNGFWKLRPIVAATATATAPTTAGVVPAAGIIDAEVRTAHVAVAGLLPFAGVRRRYHAAALAVAAVQEVMREFLAGYHTRTDR
jgi:hypothetical protein